MKYPVAREPGDGRTACGVVIPDLPGCCSAGDTLGEGVDNARKAVESGLETAIDDDGAAPESNAISVHLTSTARVRTRIDAAAKAAGGSSTGPIARRATA